MSAVTRGAQGLAWDLDSVLSYGGERAVLVVAAEAGTVCSLPGSIIFHSSDCHVLTGPDSPVTMVMTLQIPTQ